MNEFRLDQLTPGLRQSFSVTVTTSMMKDFQSISGDCSPIHMDEAYAKHLGFKDRVVYGMLTASFYSTLVGVYLPGKYALLHSVDCSFPQPVFVGDELEVIGEVTEVNDTFNQVEIKAQIKKKDGQVVSRAKIKAGVRGG